MTHAKTVTLSVRVPELVRRRLDHVSAAMDARARFSRVLASDAARTIIERGVASLELELGLSRCEAYTYRVRWEDGVFFATCDEFPAVSYSARYEHLALVAAQCCVQDEIEAAERRGDPVPAPRRPCSSEGCTSVATEWCSCEVCRRLPVTSRRFHCCKEHAPQVRLEHRKWYSNSGVWESTPSEDLD